jgi:hypothetical protein
MDWVMILSVQWVVFGAPGPETTLANGNYASEDLCKAAAQIIKTEITAPVVNAQARVRAACVRK